MLPHVLEVIKMSSLDKKGALKHCKTGIIHQVQEEIVHKLMFLHRKSRHESVLKLHRNLSLEMLLLLLSRIIKIIVLNSL